MIKGGQGRSSAVIQRRWVRGISCWDVFGTRRRRTGPGKKNGARIYLVDRSPRQEEGLWRVPRPCLSAQSSLLVFDNSQRDKFLHPRHAAVDPKWWKYRFLLNSGNICFTRVSRDSWIRSHQFLAIFFSFFFFFETYDSKPLKHIDKHIDKHCNIYRLVTRI